MSFYNLYLGYADDATFKWDGGDFNGNIPNIVVNFGSMDLCSCGEARQLLESPKYGGRVLDWGSSGARLTKSQVIQFLTEFYPDESLRNEMIRKLDIIPEDRLCLLFACET